MVLDRASGDTHFLEEPCATAISEIVQKPQTTAELTITVGKHFEVTDHEMLSNFISDMLLQLQQLNLVEC